MKNIVCDTNIWYDLSSGRVQQPDKEKYHLIATHINIDELAITPNLLIDYKLVQNTIISIFKNYQLAKYPNAIEYLIQLNKVEYDNSLFLSNYNEILTFTENIANDCIDPSKIHELEKYIVKRKEDLSQVANYLNIKKNKMNRSLKTIIRKNFISKEKYWKKNTIKETQKCIMDYVFYASSKKYTLGNDFDWSRVELFLHTVDYFIKDIVMTGRNINANDFYDFSNLVYVSPNDLYWTNEKYWIRVITDAGMSKYLYGHK